MIESTAQLLALPPEERQIVIVLADDFLREIDRRVPRDRAKRFLKSAAGGLGGAAAGAGGAAVGGGAVAAVGAGAGTTAAGLAAATAGVAAAPVLMPALAVGAVGLGAAAFLTRARGGLPLGVKVISASAARGLTFTDGPFKLGEVYAAHPMLRGRYVPRSDYQRTILQERARETETFFLSCGASRIEMIVEYGDDLSFSAGAGYTEIRGAASGKVRAKRKESTKRRTVLEAPGRLEPEPLAPSEWVWFPAEPEWQELHRRRSESGITGYELTTDIADDRSINLSAVAKIPGVKLNGETEAKCLSRTLWKWKVTFPAAGVAA